jgi:hypothetical protein
MNGYREVDANGYREVDRVPRQGIVWQTTTWSAGQIVTVEYGDVTYEDCAPGYARWCRVTDQSCPLNHSDRVTFYMKEGE